MQRENIMKLAVAHWDSVDLRVNHLWFDWFITPETVGGAASIVNRKLWVYKYIRHLCDSVTADFNKEFLKTHI